KVNPRSAMILTNLGYSYYLSGQYVPARREFQKATMAQPGYVPAISNLGLLYARQGEYDKAIQRFKTVMETHQAYNDVGYIAFGNGDLEQAADMLAEAIRLSPKYYEVAQKNLAAVQKEMGSNYLDIPAELLVAEAESVTLPDNQRGVTHRVTASGLNVRDAGTSGAAVSGYVRNNDIVLVLMTRDGWAFIEYPDRKSGAEKSGWVNDRYLEKTTGTVAQLAPVKEAPELSKPVLPEPRPVISAPGSGEEVTVAPPAEIKPQAGPVVSDPTLPAGAGALPVFPDS
ncbi:MAG: tetratricopeptide repeat protein, partial [bacterium]